jgi:uncharacterized protein
MFSIDLNHLQRARLQDLAGILEVGDGTWESWGVQPEESVRVSLQVAFTGTGQLIARGSLQGSLTIPCRRCLAGVRIPLEEALDLLWVPEAALEGEEDGEVRILPASGVLLDLEPTLLEELFLRIPNWVVCREDCAGLCSSCGAELHEDTCGCAKQEGDPRWEALRKITFDQRK